MYNENGLAEYQINFFFFTMVISVDSVSDSGFDKVALQKIYLETHL